MLYMAGGEGEKAKKAVDFGLKALQYQGVKGGYVLALLRGRLKSDVAAGAAKRLYDQAEELHDETLYRLATVTQELAQAQFGSPPKPADDGAKAGQPAKRSAAADAKAEKQRLAALLKARAEALPYWQDLIKRYPNSPRREPALYYAGVLLYEAAEAAPAAKSDQLLKDADALFDRLLDAYPKSPYAGDAFVRRIDFALERKFDLKLAQSLADRGIEWAKNQKVEVATATDGTLTKQSLADAAKAIQAASAKLPEWAETGGKPPAELLNDLYNLYLRAGILAYLQEKYEEAVPYLDAAGPVQADGRHVGQFRLPEDRALHPGGVRKAQDARVVSRRRQRGENR